MTSVLVCLSTVLYISADVTERKNIIKNTAILKIFVFLPLFSYFLISEAYYLFERDFFSSSSVRSPFRKWQVCNKISIL